MNITYGPCRGPRGDGKWRVRLGQTFLLSAYDSEAMAYEIAKTYGARRRILKTTFTMGVRDVRADPGVPAEDSPPGVDRSRFKELTVADIVLVLATGEFDEQLDDFADMERAGTNRKGALAAIEARQAHVLESEVREHFTGELVED